MRDKGNVIEKIQWGWWFIGQSRCRLFSGCCSLIAHRWRVRGRAGADPCVPRLHLHRSFQIQFIYKGPAVWIKTLQPGNERGEFVALSPPPLAVGQLYLGSHTSDPGGRIWSYVNWTSKQSSTLYPFGTPQTPRCAFRFNSFHKSSHVFRSKSGVSGFYNTTTDLFSIPSFLPVLPISVWWDSCPTINHKHLRTRSPEW